MKFFTPPVTYINNSEINSIENNIIINSLDYDDLPHETVTLLNQADNFMSNYGAEVAVEFLDGELRKGEAKREQIRKKDWSLQFKIGLIYIDDENYKKALQAFNNTLEISETPEEKSLVLNNLAILAKYNGNDELAIQLCIDATKIDPRNEIAAHNLNVLKEFQNVGGLKLKVEGKEVKSCIDANEMYLSSKIEHRLESYQIVDPNP